jgi:hypothetical protein
MIAILIRNIAIIVCIAEGVPCFLARTQSARTVKELALGRIPVIAVHQGHAAIAGKISAAISIGINAIIGGIAVRFPFMIARVVTAMIILGYKTTYDIGSMCCITRSYGFSANSFPSILFIIKIRIIIIEVNLNPPISGLIIAASCGDRYLIIPYPSLNLSCVTYCRFSRHRACKTKHRDYRPYDC